MCLDGLINKELLLKVVSLHTIRIFFLPYASEITVFFCQIFFVNSSNMKDRYMVIIYLFEALD